MRQGDQGRPRPTPTPRQGEKIKSVPHFLRTEVEDCEEALTVVARDERFEGLGVRWNARLKVVAGSVICIRESMEPLVIELNSKLKSVPSELRVTILHEVAHALVFFRGLSTADGAHGLSWRLCCEEVGYSDPQRYHEFTSIPRLQGKIVAICFACKIESHGKRYRDQTAVYVCRRCGGVALTDREKLKLLS